MSYEIKIGDGFLKIPELTADGNNWVAYKERLLLSLDTRELKGHVDGSETKPVDPKSLEGRGKDWVPLTKDEKREVNTWRDEMKTWRRGEAVVKQQIAGTIPDTLFMQVKQFEMAYEIFGHLAKLFQKRSRVVAVEILRKMQNLRCREKDDVRSHFDKLRNLREQLASMDQAPTDDSFTAIVISSLPLSYQPQIGAVMALAKVTGMTITSSTLMETVLDAYDSRNAGGRKEPSERSEDAAYKATGESRKFHGNCFKCGEYGHRAYDCDNDGRKAAKGHEKSPESGDEKATRKRATEKAAAAKDSDGNTSDAEPDGVWLAFTKDDCWSEGQSDWLTEVVEEDSLHIKDIENTSSGRATLNTESLASSRGAARRGQATCDHCGHVNVAPTKTNVPEHSSVPLEGEQNGLTSGSMVAKTRHDGISKTLSWRAEVPTTLGKVEGSNGNGARGRIRSTRTRCNIDKTPGRAKIRIGQTDVYLPRGALVGEKGNFVFGQTEIVGDVEFEARTDAKEWTCDEASEMGRDGDGTEADGSDDGTTNGGSADLRQVDATPLAATRDDQYVERHKNVPKHSPALPIPPTEYGEAPYEIPNEHAREHVPWI
ncbi:hypothetical protein ID866_11240 [Astraeus odoratus]|nr:hypothetical protein ID866_11240 [Astraeus odoratus]